MYDPLAVYFCPKCARKSRVYLTHCHHCYERTHVFHLPDTEENRSSAMLSVSSVADQRTLFDVALRKLTPLDREYWCNSLK